MKWLLNEAGKIAGSEGLLTLGKQIPGAVYARTVPLKTRLTVRMVLQALNGYDNLAHPLEPIFIDPAEIRYCSVERFVPEDRYLGKILDGEWDQNRKPLAETSTFRGLKSRFVAGKAWEETPYYQNAVCNILEHGEYFGYSNCETFLSERCEYVDTLFERIQERGFESDPTLYDDRRPWSHFDPTGVSVLLTREGELLLHDGLHRVTIARILDIEEIPVYVLVRHTEWQTVREADKSNDATTSEYQDHPDL